MSDLICLSHLRWDFVLQRPQHLMSRFARDRRVFFLEEPVVSDGERRTLDVSRRENGVYVALPKFPVKLSRAEADSTIQELLAELRSSYGISDYILWYYTPMAMPFTRDLTPRVSVYDCMDELSHFAGADPKLVDYERELLRRVDLVFTGGQTLYEYKRAAHPRVYPFPSSIDASHFERARAEQSEPADQSRVGHPRIGYFGVIDERLDLELLDGVARARPDWSFVFLGPIVKIDPSQVPSHPNIHLLGQKDYQELPAYLSGWDVAILPFAKNDATRFISPTKTPEYLAGGRRVVSTSITDVVQPYGTLGLVEIADSVEEFVTAIERMLEQKDDTEWAARVREHLSGMSWDRTWQNMVSLMAEQAGGSL